MAFEVNVSVYEGPNKWSMLLQSLYEGKSVRFKLVRLEMVVGNQPHQWSKSDWFDARIMGLDRAGNDKRSFRENKIWELRGEILCGASGQFSGLIFKGTYDSHVRKGEFTIEERQYVGGDAYFTTQNNRQLKPSEVIRFEKF